MLDGEKLFFGSQDGIVYGLNARNGIPDARTCERLHLWTRHGVDEKLRLRCCLDDKKEIGAVAGPGSAFQQIFRIETRGDGVAQSRTRRFCKLDELYGIQFFSDAGLRLCS